jgi:hypothetical protein
MKRKFDFIPEDEDTGDIGFVPDFEDDSEEEDCPYLDILASIAFQDKPFGILWSKDKVNEFLKARGYKLIDRKNKDTGDEYTIAVKPDSSSIPDDGHGNTKEVFDSEMQDIIMRWILRIAKENDERDTK